MDSSAFANGLVAIEQLLFLIDKARGQGMAHAKRALHGIHFLFREFTSADATEYAIVLVHSCLLFALCYTQASLQAAEQRGPADEAEPHRTSDPLNSQVHPRVDLHPEKERRCRVKESEILH